MGLFSTKKDATIEELQGSVKTYKMAAIGLGVAVLGLIGWIAFK